MKYQRITDTHVHTDNSPDGNHSAMLLCETAENTGIRAIAFCDHCDVDVFYKDNYDRRVTQAYFEVARARSAFLGKLLVLEGIELGEPAYEPELSEKIISSQEYDFVIGSLHNLRGREDFYYMTSFEGVDIDALVREYFDELLIMTQWGKFDTIAHITYPFRYFYKVAGVTVDIQKYKKQTDELFSLLAEKDIALEINTAGLRQPINKTSPELDSVKRFKQLGGRMITVGSDAHYAEHLGAGIETGMDMALEAGFKAVTIFQKRVPLEIPIE
ncbi:MAG: histidinol-phosphatase HisJ family protein [Clostridiales bacterium]|nr:histidinol-phosphatase HisJ family protein [Clostridiales bacterium]